MIIGVAEKAYTAGILDGEGSIQINPSQSQARNKYWNLSIQISSNDIKMVKRLLKIWEIGSITKWKAKGSKRNRMSYNWRIHCSKSGWFLTSLLPYLIIKKEHAKVGIKFRKYTGIKGTRLSKEAIVNRNKLAKQLRKLNLKNGKGKLRPFQKGVK